MNRLQKITLTIAAASLLAPLPAPAQSRARTSPHETVSEEVGGAHLTLVYGRPFSKKPKSDEVRKVWGGLVPFDKVWRTGADEATLFTTDKDLDVEGTALPAGKYSIYSVPTPEGGKLIFNKQVGQWGTEYNEKQDAARIDLKKTATTKPFDQFTVELEHNGADAGYIALRWENTEYYVGFKPKG